MTKRLHEYSHEMWKTRNELIHRATKQENDTIQKMKYGKRIDAIQTDKKKYDIKG